MLITIILSLAVGLYEIAYRTILFTSTMIKDVKWFTVQMNFCHFAGIIPATTVLYVSVQW